MNFKFADIWVQVLVVIATIVAPFIIKDSLGALIICCAIFYLGMGIWQLISTLVHFIKPQLVRFPRLRKVYHLLLLPALVLCVILPLGDMSNFTVFTAMTTGFLMAAFYFSITIAEFRKMKKE
ncbi:MAG: hypothetical protein F9K23_10705 [Bacteroidetes bacterium]|nr:MAG: hypothetical protein F9K23_10705 [Bacteroidota bacterium]